MKRIEELKQIINEFKTIEKIEVNSFKFLKSQAYELKLNNGRVIVREKLIKGNNDGSAAIIVPIVGNEILTVIEPRVFTKLTVGIGFPAGYIENNETPEEAALRELQEETGYTPKSIEEILSFYQDEGCSAALNHIFIAYDCKKLNLQNLDKDEIIKYKFFSYNELKKLEQLGYIKRGNNLLALEKIKTYMKGR